MYRLVCGKYEGFDYAHGLDVTGFASRSVIHDVIASLRGEGYRIFIVYENGEVVARVDDIASLHNGLMALK